MNEMTLKCMAYDGECCKDCRFYVQGYCQCKDKSTSAYRTACADFEEM